MPKAKKRFIDKKKSVTFNLVHRSQKDPLIADETAPQRVLVPVNVPVPKGKEKEQELLPEQRKEEQHKYGIYFDDDYNYLQHLKDTREVTMVLQPKSTHKPKKTKPQDDSTSATNLAEDAEEPVKVSSHSIQLPSSVFASEYEEEVGLLNKAASQGLCLELDPDVVAALDEDFDFDNPDNQLEDNFIEMAMAEGDHAIKEEDEDDSSGSDGDSERACGSDDDLHSDDSEDNSRPSWDQFAKEETKSRFSQFSMSSSVMRRNKGLSLLDDRFEKMFEEYDDTEMGALDCEEIEGYLPDSADMLVEAAKEFERSQLKFQLDKAKELSRIKHLQKIAEEQSSDEELVEMPVAPQERWDCESILTTYSTFYNHPKLIQEPKKARKIKINPKTGLPMDVLGKDANKLTMKSLAKFNAMQDDRSSDSEEDGKTNDGTVLSTLSVLSIRPKDETPEEKKERKRLLKEYRKERRIERKANTEAFKEEKKRQEKIAMNNRNNVQGNRIL